jgi:hypothetical protein
VSTLALLWLAAPRLLAAPAVALPSSSVESVFHIGKSENRNQVHYAVHVDDACRPVGAQPVFAYWRELERGPNAISPLLERERPAYGIAQTRQTRPDQQDTTGGRVEVRLRAIPKRPLVIELFKAGTTCGARALVSIHKQPAVLTSVYVDMGALFSVNYALVRGIRVADGQPLQEKVLPGE